MIAENREIISLNVWGVVAPALLLAVLTIGVNLLGDAYAARSLGGCGMSREAADIPDAGRRSMSACAAGEAIVEDVDLKSSPGEILGLVGESGSGKTTTARALLGYSGPGVEIDAGSLAINGTPPADGRVDALRPAARRSPTCRRIRAARSTRSCGSRTPSPTCSPPTDGVGQGRW